MTKHTPGPWAVTHEEQRRTIFGVVGPLGNGQATLLAKIPRPNGGDDMTSLATARLIAAAPDLLAALQKQALHLNRLVGNMKSRVVGADPKAGAIVFAEVPDWAIRQQLEELTIAIAKATGEQA